MAQLDRKNRAFYDDLTDEEKKKFSLYLMLRWSSSVQGSRELQEYYVQSCNHYLNKHFFAINRHPKLQWLCATAVSPGMGQHRHQWIAPKKKDGHVSANRKQLAELFPNYKDSDIDLLSAITTDQEVKQYLQGLGRDK